MPYDTMQPPPPPLWKTILVWKLVHDQQPTPLPQETPTPLSTLYVPPPKKTGLVGVPPPHLNKQENIMTPLPFMPQPCVYMFASLFASLSLG